MCYLHFFFPFPPLHVKETRFFFSVYFTVTLLSTQYHFCSSHPARCPHCPKNSAVLFTQMWACVCVWEKRKYILWDAFVYFRYCLPARPFPQTQETIGFETVCAEAAHVSRAECDMFKILMPRFSMLIYPENDVTVNVKTNICVGFFGDLDLGKTRPKKRHYKI